jgi:hypothetical protein
MVYDTMRPERWASAYWSSRKRTLYSSPVSLHHLYVSYVYHLCYMSYPFHAWWLSFLKWKSVYGIIVDWFSVAYSPTSLCHESEMSSGCVVTYPCWSKSEVMSFLLHLYCLFWNEEDCLFWFTDIKQILLVHILANNVRLHKNLKLHFKYSSRGKKYD